MFSDFLGEELKYLKSVFYAEFIQQTGSDLKWADCTTETMRNQLESELNGESKTNVVKSIDAYIKREEFEREFKRIDKSFARFSYLQSHHQDRNFYIIDYIDK